MSQTGGISFVGLAAIMVVALAIGCLLSRRTRPFGLVILGLAAFGLLFARVSFQPSPTPGQVVAEVDRMDMFARVSSQPSPLPATEIHVSDAQLVDNLYDPQSAAKEAQARRDSEIVKNQRLAARMDDAFVQTSPDGSTLETYPDGMQIKQDQWGIRSIVRPADGEANSIFTTVHGGQSSRTQVKLWILGAPLLALVVAFLALRRGKHGGGVGAALVVACLAALVLSGFFFTFAGSQRQSAITMTLPQTPSPPALISQSSQANAELARVHAEMISNLQSAVPQESVETLWSKLTQPKINLDPAAAPETQTTQATQNELANAAKMILSASAPGADPFTQGWLMNAAKAIMNATPKAGEGQDYLVAPSAADAMSEPIAQYEAQEKAARAAVKASEPDKPKPDWVVNPPKLVGNTRRFVVSTDPYSTVAECHAALREQLRGVVQTRVDELARAANGGRDVRFPGLDSMGISIEYILSELCPEEDYIETINTSVGEMKRAYALVEFNEAQDRFLLDRWRDDAREDGLEVIGVLSAFVVAGLAFVYGLLKVDTWTRGYYTKRLFLGVPAAIIAVFFIAALFGA